MTRSVRWDPVAESPAPENSDWEAGWNVSVTEITENKAFTTTYEATSGVGEQGQTRIIWEELVCHLQRGGVKEVQNQSGSFMVDRIERKQEFLKTVRSHYNERRRKEKDERDHVVETVSGKSN